MTKQPVSSKKQKGYWGTGLVTVGLVALLLDLGVVVQPFSHLIQTAQNGLAGVTSLAGLSLLNAVRSVAFHQVDYLALSLRILVLFLAMLAVIVGIVLMRSRSSRTLEANGLRSSGLHEEEIQ